METTVSGGGGEFVVAMNLLPPALLFIFALTLTAHSSEPIDLKNSAGKSIRAELISLDPVTNTIRYKRLRDERIFTSPIGIFDGPTQERLKSNTSAESPTSVVSVNASQKLAYDRAKDLWKETIPVDASPGSNDIYRTVFDLKNNQADDLTNLKADIVVVIESDADKKILRQERQTFSIMRLRTTRTIQVTSKRYEIHASGNDKDSKEAVRGTALRLRDVGSGETLFVWQSDSLSGTEIIWEKQESDPTSLAAMIED